MNKPSFSFFAQSRSFSFLHHNKATRLTVFSTIYLKFTRATLKYGISRKEVIYYYYEQRKSFSYLISKQTRGNMNTMWGLWKLLKINHFRKIWCWIWLGSIWKRRNLPWRSHMFWNLICNMWKTFVKSGAQRYPHRRQ